MRHCVQCVIIACCLIASGQHLQAETRDHQSELGAFSVEKLADFYHPWGMAFVSSTVVIVTERSGTAWLFNKQSGSKTPLNNPPRVLADGQGGLLDVALHPDFKQNGWVYFTLSKSKGGGSGTAVVRAQLNGLDKNRPTLSNHQTLFQAKPSFASRHFGSRLAFAPDGTLFVTIGDHGQRPRAQDTSNASGSVIRLNADGSIPSDNPSFSKRSDKSREGLWSIGHRNAQGAAIHPETGELWTVEHGARGGDEINKPLAGKNYGWPEISYGRHYSGAEIGLGTKAKGMEQPIHYWDPSIAPSGMAFYKGDLFPQWKGNLFIGALKDRMLVRLALKNHKVISEERLLKNAYGRIRDVRSGPDGALWILTDAPDGALLRVTPQS